MAEYIKREDVMGLETYGVEVDEHFESCVAIYDIENLPAADVVEVVRCKDCKHSREKNAHEKAYLIEEVLICTSDDVTDDCWCAVFPEHWCSYGERREP